MRAWLGTLTVTIAKLLATDASVQKLVELLNQGGLVAARGSVGSSTILLTAALTEHIDSAILLVVGHLDQADEAVDELEAAGVNVAKFPAMEQLPGESTVNVELITERLRLLRKLASKEGPSVLVAPIHALMQTVPAKAQLKDAIYTISIGQALDLNSFTIWMQEAGYTRVETIESPGEYTIRGGIIDIFCPGEAPKRIDLFGDVVEGLFEVDLDTLASDRRLEQIELTRAAVKDEKEYCGEELLTSYLAPSTVAILAEIVEITEQGRSYMDRTSDARNILTCAEVIAALVQTCHAVAEVNQYSPGSAPDKTVDLPVQPLVHFDEDASKAVVELADLSNQWETIVMCQNDGEAQRIGELLNELAPNSRVKIQTQYVHRGFLWSG